MDQLEQYDFKRDMFTGEVQKIYLAKDQTYSNDFFKQRNIDEKRVIEIFQPQLQYQIDYMQLIKFNNDETKKIVLEIIIRYLEKHSEQEVNRVTLDKIRQNYPENQSELMPPQIQSIIIHSPNNLGHQTQSNISQTQSNLGPPIQSSISQSPSNQGSPTQDSSQINQQIILELLPVTKTCGLTQQR